LTAALGLGLLPACAATKHDAKATTPKPNAPWLRLAFDDLGIPPLSLNFLSAGSSLMTVNFLDSSHLLVTFGTRALVPRIPDDPITDDDRMVAAEIVELPSGAVLARTDWHLHDHSRYLWKLANGRFLLRMGNEFSMVAPQGKMKSPSAFARVAVGYSRQRPSAVVISSDGTIVTIETEIRSPDEARVSSSGITHMNGFPLDEPKVTAAFFRVEESGDTDNPVRFISAGAVRASRGFVLPADGDGFLRATAESHGRWAVLFDEFGGREVGLGELQSSCPPAFFLASRSEFLVISCRGTGEDLKLSSYGFDGHETWEEPFSSFSSLAFAFAPQAGRFAMSRVTAAGSLPEGIAPEQSGGPGQEIRIYGTESGDLLLRVHTSPIFRTAENFDLSADGMELATIENGNIDVYRLPELTKRDRDDLEEVRKFAPPSTTAFSLEKIAHPIGGVSAHPVEATEAPAVASAQPDSGAAGTQRDSAGPAAPSVDEGDAITAQGSAGAQGSAAAPQTAGAVAVQTATAAPVGTEAAAKNAGDPPADADARRKPPTLLKPGEAPEAKNAPAKPQ
jgi:hypothetical protein